MLSGEDEERQRAVVIAHVEGESTTVEGVLAGEEFEVATVGAGDSGFQPGFRIVPRLFDGSE
ncbi:MULTISPECIES: hypothetical protein [Frankia]|uniref:hypothetical protein n=1 Tax=Frankia TaxID=1854 RepID=UPI0005BE3E66|nr:MULTISPECIES: hypothetical protein [Frankia]